MNSQGQRNFCVAIEANLLVCASARAFSVGTAGGERPVA